MTRSKWQKREGGHYQQSDQAGRGTTLASGQSGRGGHYQQLFINRGTNGRISVGDTQTEQD